MPVYVTMPKSGMTMTEGVIAQWCKQEGETIKEGEVLAEILADKATIELEAPASGVVAQLLYPEGSTVPIYEVIAVIAQAGESVANAVRPDRSMVRDNESQSEMRHEEKTVKATPVAKRLAKGHGIDLASLAPGSGPGGRIKEEDVIKYLSSQAGRNKPEVNPPLDKRQDVELPKVGEEEIIPLVGMRKMIAENLRRSHDTAVHVTSTTEVDLTDLIALRKQLAPSWEKQYGVQLTLNAFFVKAVALALKEHLILNSSLVNGNIVIKKYYHIGLAVSLEDGLIVPVIRDADKLSVKEIAKHIQLLVEKARSGKLSPDEVTGGTFTISNVGPYQVQFFTPVIVQPQSAVLGIGTTTERPVVRDGEIVIRSMANLCLTYDHRIIQGVPAAQFRLSVKYLLEDPYSLLS